MSEINREEQKRILVADSCAGGISVLNKIRKAVSDKELFYLADYEKNPFGLKEKGEIQEIVKSWLDGFGGIDVLIISCNTASIASEEILDGLADEYSVKIVSMIQGLKKSLEENRNIVLDSNVALLGTKFTVNSELYEEILRTYKPNEIVKIPITETEAIVARGDHKTSREAEIIKDEIGQYSEYDIDTALLGCTVLEPVEDLLEASLGENLSFVNPNKGVANSLGDCIDGMKMEPNSIDFYTTGDVAASQKKINALSQEYLGHEVKVKNMSLYR